MVNVSTMLWPAATPPAGTVTPIDVPLVLLCAVPIVLTRVIAAAGAAPRQSSNKPPARVARDPATRPRNVKALTRAPVSPARTEIPARRGRSRDGESRIVGT